MRSTALHLGLGLGLGLHCAALHCTATLRTTHAPIFPWAGVVGDSRVEYKIHQEDEEDDGALPSEMHVCCARDETGGEGKGEEREGKGGVMRECPFIHICWKAQISDVWTQGGLVHCN